MSSSITWEVDPMILSGVEFLRWYGVCWATGLLLAIGGMRYLYRTDKIPETELDQLVTYAVIGIIIGARMGHVLCYDPVYYWNHPLEILPISTHPSFRLTGLAGLASHGGVAGVLLALYAYHRKFERGYWWILDRIAMVAAPLFACIRIGNLMNSEIIGHPTNLPWAFIFLRVDNLPRHPVQLYEALCYLVTGVLLWMLWKSGKFASSNGFIFGTGAVLMGSERFIVEFLKENQSQFGEQFVLNMGQVLSIPMILIGMFIMIRSRKTVPSIKFME